MGFTVTRRGTGYAHDAGRSAGQFVYPTGGDDTALLTAAMAAGKRLAGGGATFILNSAGLLLANSVIRGGGGRGNTIIKAGATGNFTNGSRNAAPFLLKWNGGDRWAHGVQVTGVKFDTSGIAGLGAMYLESAGENSWFDDLRCDSCVATSRTRTDAQISNASNVVTFTASTVIEDDVNGFVTDRTDGDYTQAGPTIPALTKIDRVNYANPLAFPAQTTATSITLSKSATGNAADSSFTIYRPTTPFVTESDSATGRMGTLNGILNQGPLLWQKGQQNGGSWSIDSLSGDSNWGGNHRVSRSNTGDPLAITVKHLKVENNQVGANAAMMDPVVLLDRCDMVTYKIETASIVPGVGGGRDVLRVDQPQTRPPAITLDELEGNDPFNNAYTNIYHDTSTGLVVPSSATNTLSYPKLYVNRNVLLVSQGTMQTIKGALTYSASITPDLPGGTWRTITATNTTAFTINAPTNPPDANHTTELTIEVLNSSGGVMGAITWNAAFVFPTGAWANPANGKKRFARFEWNGASWICTSVASADY